MWKDGRAHWTSVQMDAIALPILLADKLRQEGVLNGYDPWQMVRCAAEYLLKFGPVTEQDRWEKLGGYSVSSMAVQIAALLAAADFADSADQRDDAIFLRETADAWNVMLDEFLYTDNSELAK